METRKVFVGNVPFLYNMREFSQCFKDVPGFVKAEIVCRPNTNTSRGFGFITLNSEENARKLINRHDIRFRDRCLRFTEYYLQDGKGVGMGFGSKGGMEGNEIITNTNMNLNPNIDRNYLLVKNISFVTTRDELKRIFSKYGKVGRHFIVTSGEVGVDLGWAIVEIIDDEIFENLLRIRHIRLDGDRVIEMTNFLMHRDRSNGMQKMRGMGIIVKRKDVSKNVGLVSGK